MKKTKKSLHATVPEISSSDFKSLNQKLNIMIVFLIILSLFSSYLFLRVKNLEKSKSESLNQPTIAQQPPQRPTSLKIKKPTVEEHWQGSKNVRYVWVEYSDLECSFCKRIHPDIKKLLQVYDGKIAWVFRHYPLSFHPKAQKSAEATECATELAGNEGFWQMLDLIFEKMPEMTLADLPDLASQIGISKDAFQQCLDSGKYEKKVKDNFDEGSRAGVVATPTSVIYDLKTGKTKLIEGALPYENLKQELDNFLAENR